MYQCSVDGIQEDIHYKAAVNMSPGFTSILRKTLSVLIVWLSFFYYKLFLELKTSYQFIFLVKYIIVANTVNRAMFPKSKE